MLFATKVFSTLALTSAVAQATIVTYNWNITYVNANPDGQYERRVIGINGQFPPPPIVATMNDTLVINVINQIDEPTSLHCHGLFQTGNNQMDGPSMVTQCPIPPGASFTYNIPIEQAGTYWIHGHHKGHYVDGLRAPLIIHNINETYKYDGEYTIAFADWYHDQHADLLNHYLSIFNPSGAEPVPKSGLINQMPNTTFSFVPGKTYRLRVINMAALAMFHFHIDGHDMDIIEVDGVDVQRATVKSFPISAAQRYSVLVTAKSDASFNYILHGDMDPMMFDTVPSDLVLNVTGTIVYNEASPLAMIETSDWPEFDDATLLAPVIPLGITSATVQHTLSADFSVLDDYVNRATFNDVTYVMPKVPSMYTAMSMGNLSSNPEVYGKYSNAIVLNHNDWVEIIINNADAGNHPFHLHGHIFQVIGRGDGIYDGSSPYNYYNTTNPLRRDTVYIPSETNAAIHFKADNPGVWFFHCHIEWHLQAGLAVTMVEAPDVMQQVLKIDPTHFQQCEALGIPYRGNAAGKEGLDLSGANVGPNALPDGFTGKGIVALVFSIIAAILGLIVVVWYAQGDDKVVAKMVQKAKTKRALEIFMLYTTMASLSAIYLKSLITKRGVPKVPTIYTAISMGYLLLTSEIYGKYASSMIFNHNDWIEIVINNADDALFRLDAMFIVAQSNSGIRFKADKPGMWFFHCHIVWHLQVGLAMAVIEAISDMQQVLEIDPIHSQQYQDLRIPYIGNATGNLGHKRWGEIAHNVKNYIT
ncbi:hypothetical protein BGX27_009927 [Mortierella sp. AM989]|nr:hypothetical protein BGX27_009927 [Mortierella sp. AM989]